MATVSAKLDKVAESVKESLVGTELEPELSQQSRNEFMQHAVRDSASGDWYLGEKEFINAVAPEGEDYVSLSWDEKPHKGESHH